MDPGFRIRAIQNDDQFSRGWRKVPDSKEAYPESVPAVVNWNDKRNPGKRDFSI
jgi:hypothetical protein